MLANVHGKVNPLLPGLAMLAIGVIMGIVILIKSMIFAKKNGNYLKLKYNLIAVSFVMIAIASWFMNMGWLRFIMTFLLVPIIHTIAFMIINNLSLSYIDQSNKLKRIVILTYITYLLGYLLLPDSGGFGPMYVFFGLIHNDVIASIAFDISSVAFIGNIVLLIMQIVERRKVTKESNHLYFKQPF